MKIVSYKTVSAKSTCELDKQINQLMETGYQPYGNPYASERPGEAALGDFSLFQAMILDQDATDAMESEAERILRGGRTVKK